MYKTLQLCHTIYIENKDEKKRKDLEGSEAKQQRAGERLGFQPQLCDLGQLS